MHHLVGDLMACSHHQHQKVLVPAESLEVQEVPAVGASVLHEEEVQVAARVVFLRSITRACSEATDRR